MLRWSLTLAVAALLAVPASAADQTITAGPGFEFSPDRVEVDVGDTVTWNNAGGFHNVKFEDGSFEQPADPDSSSWSVERTFDTSGTFRFYCEQHRDFGMSGTVAVRDATGTVPEPVEVEPGLTLRARGEQPLRRLLRRGLRARARCVNGCEITLRLSLAPRVAKRLGFRRRRTTIGRETVTLPLDETMRLDVALRRKAKRKLDDAERPFRVRLDARAEKDTTETARRKIKIVP